MRKGNKNLFIDGFKDSNPIVPLNDILTVDLKGDGDNQLLLFDTVTSSILIYKGVNKETEKAVDLKNVSHMISFYEQDSRTPQPCIMLGSQNHIYIFRGLKESFRLKVPDLNPSQQEQAAWCKLSSDMQALTTQLTAIQKTKKLSELGRYLIGANTKQRKQQLIKIAFEDGIVEKDAVSCLGVVRLKESITTQNVIVCTQLKQLHILDNFGHVVLTSVSLDFAGFMVFGEGQVSTNYKIVCVGREGSVAVITNGFLTETFSLPSRVRSCNFDSSSLYVLTINRNVIGYDLTTTQAKKMSFILPVDAIQIQVIRTRVFEALVIGCEKEVRVYNNGLLISKFQLEHSLQCLKFGTCGRQENCLVLVYEQQKGFEVKIMHRQFNPNFKYQKEQLEKSKEEIQLPKVSKIFADQMSRNDNDSDAHKMFQRDLKIMKWRTLTERLKGLRTTNSKFTATTTVVGIGPHFVVKLSVMNTSSQTIFNLRIGLNFQAKTYSVQEYRSEIPMLIPNFAYPVEIHCKNISQTGQPSNFYMNLSTPMVSPLNLTVSMPQSQILL